MVGSDQSDNFGNLENSLRISKEEISKVVVASGNYADPKEMLHHLKKDLTKSISPYWRKSEKR